MSTLLRSATRNLRSAKLGVVDLWVNRSNRILDGMNKVNADPAKYYLGGAQVGQKRFLIWGFFAFNIGSCAYWLVRVIMKKPDHLRDLTAEAEQHRKAVIRRQKIAAGEDVDDEDD